MYKTIIYWELIRIECRFTKYIYNIFSGLLFLVYIISRIQKLKLVTFKIVLALLFIKLFILLIIFQIFIYNYRI